MDPKFLGFEDMRFGAFTALLRVPLAGYRLEAHGEAGVGSELPWLVEIPGVDGEPAARRYSPFDRRHAGLLGSFVNLRTPQQALRFAKRYGLLERPPRSLTRPGGALRGEPLGLWQTHVRRLLALETLAEFIEQNDRDALSEIVIWGDDPLGVSIYPGIALRRAVEEERLPAPLLEVRSGLAAGLVPFRRYTDLTDPEVLRTPNGRPRWRPGDVLEPAWLYVCDTVNRAVRGGVHSKVMPFARGQHNGAPLYFEANSLVTSLYLLLQFKLAQYEAPGSWLVDERRCQHPGCKNVFPAKGNRDYCTDPACQKWARGQRNLRYRLSKQELSPR